MTMPLFNNKGIQTKSLFWDFIFNFGDIQLIMQCISFGYLMLTLLPLISL